MQVREKVGKSRNSVFFQWFEAPEGWKVGSLKRRVRSQLARWEMEKCTPLWREAHTSQNAQSTPCSDHFWKLRCGKSARRCGAKHISKSKCTKHTMFGPLLEVEMSKKCTLLWPEAHFEVKMYKTHHVWTTFGSWDVEKVHAVVARSTFRSQNVKNTGVRATFGSWDVEKVHAIVARAHFEVNIWKTLGVRTTFGRYHGRRKGLCTLSKVRKTWGFYTIFNYNDHYTTLHSNTLHYNYSYTFTTFHYTTLHSATLHYPHTTTPSLHSTRLHYTTLHCTTLHYARLHYTQLHSTTLHSTTLHYNTLHYTTLTITTTTLHDTNYNYNNYNYNYNTLHNNTTLQLQMQLQLHYTNCITPQYTTLNYTTLLYSTLHNTLHYAMLHYTTPIALHCATLYYTTLHPIALHYTTLPHIALHYITLHCVTLHSLHHHKCNCNYTTLIRLHHSYNSTTLQLQLQVRYTTLHPAVVGEVTDQVTTANIAATPKNTAPTTFRSISGFTLRSVIHNNQSPL